MQFIKNIVPYVARNMLTLLILFFAYMKIVSPELYQNISELISFVLNDPINDSVDKYNVIVYSMLLLQTFSACLMYSKKMFNISVLTVFVIVSINVVAVLISLFYGTVSSCSNAIFNGNPYLILGVEGLLLLLVLIVYLNKSVYLIK